MFFVLQRIRMQSFSPVIIISWAGPGLYLTGEFCMGNQAPVSRYVYKRNRIILWAILRRAWNILYIVVWDSMGMQSKYL